MAFLDLQDVRIHYELATLPGADVLVFSHSLGANLSMWSGQMEALGQRFSILRYDSRGHGESAVPPFPYSVEQLSGDVLGLLDGLGIGQVHFCGLSMGGAVGQWLGVHAPNRLKRLVLCNTAAKIGTATSWNERIATVRREGIAAIAPANLGRWFTPRFHLDYPDEFARTAAMLRATNPEGYVASCAALRDMDQREEVTMISIPTMVVLGSHDPVIPAEDGHSLATSIAGAETLELNAAHLSNIEAPADFNAGLLQFLRA